MESAFNIEVLGKGAAHWLHPIMDATIAGSKNGPLILALSPLVEAIYRAWKNVGSERLKSHTEPKKG
jgi:hypothetical protein